MLVAALLAACKDDDGDGKDSGAPPSGLGLTVELAPTSTATPLLRSVHVETSVPASVTARWVSGDHDVTAAFPGEALAHDHLLLGWRPARSYVLTVTATAGGETESMDVAVVVDPLPAHFPTAQVVTGVGQREPGHTLIPMNTFAPVSPGNVVLVWDEEGEPIYVYQAPDFVLDAYEHEDGLLVLLGEESVRLAYIGWDGVERGSWSPDGAQGSVLVDAPLTATFHHDVFAVGPDEFLALGRYPQDVDAFPASYDDPLATEFRRVAVDTFVAFDGTGAVSQEVGLDEVFPTWRIGYKSLETVVEGWADWAHSNAIFPDDDGDWIVSLRHQDVIMKIDPDAPAPRWILANHDNWPPEFEPYLLTPIGDLSWPWHAHGPHFRPELGPNGEKRLTVFDNGNYGASPWTGDPVDPSPRSRVVEFEIDETAMTISQLWEFRSPAGGELYSEAVGEAEPLPNGDVLSVWGFLNTLPDGTPNAAAGLGDRSVRVIEVDASDPANVVEVEGLYLSNERSVNDRGWTGYRAERIAPLEGRIVD